MSRPEKRARRSSSEETKVSKRARRSFRFDEKVQAIENSLRKRRGRTPNHVLAFEERLRSGNLIDEYNADKFLFGQRLVEYIHRVLLPLRRHLAVEEKGPVERDHLMYFCESVSPSMVIADSQPLELVLYLCSRYVEAFADPRLARTHTLYRDHDTLHINLRNMRSNEVHCDCNWYRLTGRCMLSRKVDCSNIPYKTPVFVHPDRFPLVTSLENPFPNVVDEKLDCRRRVLKFPFPKNETCVSNTTVRRTEFSFVDAKIEIPDTDQRLLIFVSGRIQNVLPGTPSALSEIRMDVERRVQFR